MYYVPAFFETFLVLVVALAVLTWVQRRAPRARLLPPVLILGVMLPTLWGGAAVYSEQLSSVSTARYIAMGIALTGLLGSLGWAVAVRGQPVVDAD